MVSAQLKPRAKPAKAPAAPAIVAPVAVAEATVPQTKSETKPQATAEFKLLGMLGAAYAENTYVITCGGPKVGFSYSWFGFAIGFFPSLIYSDIYKNASATTPIRPNLGFGPEMSFGKVAIIAPIFYMPGDRYYYTIGIGFKF